MFLETNCEPEGYLRCVETCSSVLQIEFSSCVWRDIDLIIVFQVFFYFTLL